MWWQGGHGRWSLGGAMGDPTAVERCRGGLLDGRWSGGGRPWVSRPSSSVFGKVMGPRALRARKRRWRGPKGRREGSQVRKERAGWSLGMGVVEEATVKVGGSAATSKMARAALIQRGEVGEGSRRPWTSCTAVLNKRRFSLQ